MNKIVIEIRGGIVDYVHTSERTNIVVIDWDDAPPRLSSITSCDLKRDTFCGENYKLNGELIVDSLDQLNMFPTQQK